MTILDWNDQTRPQKEKGGGGDGNDDDDNGEGGGWWWWCTYSFLNLLYFWASSDKSQGMMMNTLMSACMHATANQLFFIWLVNCWCGGVGGGDGMTVWMCT